MNNNEFLDENGYRPNIAIVLLNKYNDKVFWGKRIKNYFWQFPQGGMRSNENKEQTMYRELQEEIGLSKDDVKIIGHTKDWLYYDVPKKFIGRNQKNIYRGQKQVWYLLRLKSYDFKINLRFSDDQEFDAWRWHDYWATIDEVISFKKKVYLKALKELAFYIPNIESYEEYKKNSKIKV